MAPGADICGTCGKPADVQPTRRHEAPKPECRQLTVMFCDLVGSTALARELDLEDLRNVTRDYQEGTRAVVARYEGVIARYEGDGVLAYFGYPEAHEDDAVRAIHAGLGIIEALASDNVRTAMLKRRLRVRIGIATGLVVVGDVVGEGPSQQYVALGETPNLAARLQARAKANTVIVAQTTRDLAGGYFDFVVDSTRRLKGFSDPVVAWRVLRTSDSETRFGGTRAERLTPLTGREREVALLMESWLSARRSRGQVVVLSGEAGIGKSRIAESLGERIAGEAQTLRYQCSPFHANSALYPFIKQLERAADFRRNDTASRKWKKLEALLAPEPRDTDTVALFAALLSLPPSERHPALALSAQQQKEKTLAALLARLRGFAKRGPVFLLFEDAHWIDPTSIELLALGAREVSDAQVLAVITTREVSGGAYPWIGEPGTSLIELERLDRNQTVMMVDGMLREHPLPPALIDEIVDRTDGVPLFIEELTKTLITSDLAENRGGGAGTLGSHIPSTLHDSLIARLDRLGSAKEVAQIGAVIGREFSRDLIGVLSPLDSIELDLALTTLTSSGLAFERGPQPATSFQFMHALVQDAAYASLLRSQRQDLHWRIGQALEANYPEHARVEPEVVAHHYTQAGRVLEAAGYWAAAAHRSLDRSANVEALGHASKGLELLGSIVQTPQRDRLELDLEIVRGTAYRAVKGFASSEVERSFARASAICMRLDDIPRLIDARRGLFSCYYARGALALAREQGNEVSAAGQKTGDAGSRMLGHWMLGCVMFWQGEYATARRELEEAIALYDPHLQRANALALQIDPGANALLHLSWLLWILGYPEQALRNSEKAIASARQLGQPMALALALFFAAATRASTGDHRVARVLLDELIALTDAHDLGYMGSCARVLEAQQLIAQDRGEAGIKLIERAFAEFRDQEAGVGLPWAMAILAEAYVRLGRPKEGLAVLTAARVTAARNGECHWLPELYRLHGDLLLLPSGRDESAAEACFRDAISLSRAQAAKALELRAATSLARLLAGRDATTDARRLLTEAYQSFNEGFDTADLRAAANLLQDSKLMQPSAV
jgi:class 3 adenylate cyclase/tetratricopeptide (TPR) repeat protein/ABC-type transport system involved in cytochrome c biogenesis ATPase subunit